MPIRNLRPVGSPPEAGRFTVGLRPDHRPALHTLSIVIQYRDRIEAAATTVHAAPADEKNPFRPSGRQAVKILSKKPDQSF